MQCKNGTNVDSDVDNIRGNLVHQGINNHENINNIESQERTVFNEVTRPCSSSSIMTNDNEINDTNRRRILVSFIKSWSIETNINLR